MRLLSVLLLVSSLLACMGGSDEAPSTDAAPVAAPAAPGEAAPSPEPPPPPVLRGSVKVSGLGPVKTMRISNDEDQDWTDCLVTVDGTYAKSFGTLKRRATDQTPYGKFKDKNGASMPGSYSPNWVVVRCRQGLGTFKPGV